MRIPRLMKDLIIKLDRRQLETSEDLASLENGCLDCDDGPFDKGDGGGAQETMNALNVNFIMYQRRNGTKTSVIP